jgi:N-carbamoyl-L-amino-acid hydrolase
VEAQPVITAGRLNERLRGLDAIGVGSSGSVNRLAWTEEDAACRKWFATQAESVGLRAATDPAGNLWACPAGDPPWWGIGSHLDSVRSGGRFDGPLGVACGFEIAAASARPVAVIDFADEEGARFNTPTFGSKALAGRLDVDAVLERRDDRGTTLRDAMAAAGLDPARITDAPVWLDRLQAFIEVHIDQTTELARARAPLAVVRGLVERTRLEVELRGRADHAGTTPREERRDGLAAAARVIVAAEELAEPYERLTVTTARIVAEPNAPTTIAARVRLWIDARSSRREDIEAWREQLRERADQLAERARVQIEISVASQSRGVEFDARLRAALTAAGERVTGRDPPEVPSYAGHDAGVIAERIPAAMVFVRNATGVSHAPEEQIDLADAALAAEAVVQALK